MYTTVLIKMDDGIGTGFFYHHWEEPHKSFPYIVTNKHVVDGCSSAEIILHVGPLVDGRPKSTFSYEINDIESLCRFHPDPDIDICILPLPNILDAVKQTTGFDVYYQAFNKSMVPNKQDLSETLPLMDVYMIGYPDGLFDDKNNFPVFRRGITASHPGFDFQYPSRGAVDIATFQGSSGSPIVLYTDGHRRPDGWIEMSTTFALLGILESLATTDIEGRIVTAKVPKRRQKVLSQTAIHIGYYVKAYELFSISQYVPFDEYQKIIT